MAFYVLMCHKEPTHSLTLNCCKHTQQKNVLVLISGGVLTAESTPSFAEACFCFSSDPMSFIFLMSCLRSWCISKAWRQWNTFLQGQQENDSDIGSSGTLQRGSDLGSEITTGSFSTIPPDLCICP